MRTYLAIQCNTGDAGEAVLDALKAEGRSALLLFSPERMLGQDALIRRAVGEGHAVGLLVPGDSLESAQSAIEEGNHLLESIAMTRTRIVLVEEDTAGLGALLSEQGWACVQSNISGLPNGRSAAGTAAVVLQSLGEKKGLARILMDDSTASAQALPRILRTIREHKYSYRLAVETEL